MKLFIAGNSHIAALARAQRVRSSESHGANLESIQAFPFGPAAFELSPFSRSDGSAVEFLDPVARSRFTERSGLTRIERGDGLWAICLGLHTINIVRQPFWQRNQPAAVAASDAAPVSDSLCRAIIEAAQRPVRQFLLHLQAAGVAAFVVSSPPLRHDHPASESCPPDVALELDRVAREVFTTFLAEHDIHFVDHPPEARSEDGFLRDDLRRTANRGPKPDLHHANATYGAMMLDRVVRHAEAAYL